MKQHAPSKDEIALMPTFVGLTLEHVHVPANTKEFAAATAEIKAAGIVGFDTESKPTFAVGEKSTGPHVVQFALRDKAFIFQVHRAEGLPYLTELLCSTEIIKVGFGLRSDSGHILKKFGIKFGGVVDLNTVFSMRGYQKEMGVRNAVGLIFNQRFSKSGKMSTSNWSQHELSSQQLLYAANDAYGALRVFDALKLPRDKLPIMGQPMPPPK
jgi:ribonuclease D